MAHRVETAGKPAFQALTFGLAVEAVVLAILTDLTALLGRTALALAKVRFRHGSLLRCWVNGGSPAGNRDSAVRVRERKSEAGRARHFIIPGEAVNWCAAYTIEELFISLNT